MNNFNMIFAFILYFQCGSEWPRIWYMCYGNPFAVTTSPFESSNNQGTTKNSLSLDFLLFVEIHNFLHVHNSCSCCNRSFPISFPIQYLCTTHQRYFEFILHICSYSKIFHKTKWKFEIICKCLSLGTCSSSTLASTK